MIEVVYAFACSGCGEPSYQRHRIPLGATVPDPLLPNGWVQTGEKLYCHRHVVKAGAAAA